MSHLHHRVSQLIDDELGARARRRALAHVGRCASCREELAETLEVKQRLTSLSSVDVPADLLAAVESRGLDEALDVGSTDDASPWRSVFVRRALVGLGSMSAAVLALAYLVGTPGSSSAKTVVPPVGEFAADFADATGQSALSDPPVQGFAESNLAALAIGRFVSVNARPKALSAEATGCLGRRQHDEGRAVDALRSAVTAPASTGYEGVRVVTSYDGPTMQKYRLTVKHAPSQGTEFRVDGADGTAATSFLPASDGADQGLDIRPMSLLMRDYDVSVLGQQQIDGRMATVVDACRDGHLMARFWIDDDTGVLLRKDLFLGNRLVRSSTFTSFTPMKDLRLQDPPPVAEAPPSTTYSTRQAPALDDRGWICPQQLADDFDLALIGQVESHGNVMHVEYTDGLSTLSVFEERGELNPSVLSGFADGLVRGQPVYVRVGLPVVAVWQSGVTVFTLVTDAPQQRVDELIEAPPHQPPATGPGFGAGSGRASTG